MIRGFHVNISVFMAVCNASYCSSSQSTDKHKDTQAKSLYPDLRSVRVHAPPVLRTHTPGDEPETPASGAAFRVPSPPWV